VGASGCKKYGADLSAYLDGELNAKRAAAVKRHLRGCDACRAVVSELAEVSDGLAELPRMPAPDALDAAVRRRLERDALLAGGATGRRAPWMSMFMKLTGSAALIGACVITGWRVMRSTPGSTPGVDHLVEAAGERGAASPEETLGFAKADRPEGQPDADALGALKTEPPAVALAAPSPADREIITRLSPGLAELEDSSAPSAETSLPIGWMASRPVPDLVIEVQPQTFEAYLGANLVVANWSRSASGVAEPGAAPVAREVVLDVAADRANKLVQSLEQQAPGQVLLTGRPAVIAQVQQTPRDKSAVELSDVAGREGRYARRGGRAAGVDAKQERDGRARGGRAGRGRGAVEDKPAQRTRSRQLAFGAREPATKQPAPQRAADESEESPAKKESLDKLAAVTSAPAHAKTSADDLRKSESPAAADFDLEDELNRAETTTQPFLFNRLFARKDIRQWLFDAFDAQFKSAASRPAPPSRAKDAGASPRLRVRVTVYEPPAAPASRPAGGPGSER
jgi:hypothetical protein